MTIGTLSAAHRASLRRIVENSGSSVYAKSSAFSSGFFGHIMRIILRLAIVRGNLVLPRGVVITPHQFRHLAAKLFLDRHPNEHETVRRLLGHKSLETTMRYYRELEAVLAGRRYAALLDELLGDFPSRIPRHGRMKAS